MKDAFQKFNTKKSGYLSKEEVYVMLGDEMDKEISELLFKKSDFDGDGLISWEEYPGFIKEVQREYAQTNAHLLI